MEILDFSEKDTELIKQEIDKKTIALIISILIFSFVLFIAIFIIIDGYSKESNEIIGIGIFMLIVGLVLPVIMLFPIMVLYLDLKDKSKEIIKGIIQRKYESQNKRLNSYSFIVNDDEFKVDITTYTRFDKGDKIKLSVAERSRLTLSISKVG